MSFFNFESAGHHVFVKQGDGAGRVDVVIDGGSPITIVVRSDSVTIAASSVDGQFVRAIPLLHHEHHELWVRGQDHGKAESFDVGLLFDAVRKLEHDVTDIYQRLKGR